MWVLILLVHSSQSLSPITGFETKAACDRAGERVQKTFHAPKLIEYACVELERK